ncbi:MAG: MFS transporter, partial [Candidatus Marinimicrobia bacterium]|nr:MFS transporter [Candidatus Neomarinimicrobiota bacterium]
MSAPLPEAVPPALPPTLSDRQIRRGLRINMWAGALGMGWVATALGIPLIMFVERLGGSGIQLGWLAAVQQLAMLVQIPATLFVERLPARKLFWASAALLHRLLWFLPAMLPLLGADGSQTAVWALLVIVGLSALLAQAATPSWFSWMADLVPPRIGGRFWGTRSSVTTLSFLAMTALTGRLLDRYTATTGGPADYLGFSIVFSLGALLGVADVIVHLWVPEPPPHKPAPGPRLGARLWALVREADFRRLTVGMGCWYFALGINGAFGNIYLRREFGASYTHLSVLAIASALGATLAGVAWGYVIDRLGARVFGILMLILAPFTGFCWFFVAHGDVIVPGLAQPQPYVIVFLTAFFFLAGAIFSGVALAQFNLLGVLAPASGRTFAMALHWTCVGVLAALGPLTGGWIMDAFPRWNLHYALPGGVPLAFLHALVVLFMLLVWFVAVPLFAGIRRQGREVPFGDAVARLFPANPLRLFSSIFNIWLASMPASSHQRARAMRRLGEARAALSVEDLIASLSDAAIEVREEATLALGEVGGPEAIAALIGLLDDPESDLAVEAARALRRHRAPGGADALIRRLADPDRETVSECARTLGVLQDARAIAPLTDLLRTAREGKVFLAAAEALAGLGAVTAAPDIWGRLRATGNLVWRRGLAVALGDVIGERGEFYSLLLRENEVHGLSVARLLAEARAVWRRLGRRPSPSPVYATLRSVSFAAEAAYERDQLGECADWLAALGRGLADLEVGSGTLSPATEAKRQAGLAVLAHFRSDPPASGAPALSYVEILLG